jgi:4-aminobutyrate aminotransferase-like enzyme
MIGVEFCHDRDPRKPAGDLVKQITAICRDNGVLVLPASSYGNVLRVLSPLVIDDAELKRGLDVMESAILEAIGK